MPDTAADAIFAVMQMIPFVYLVLQIAAIIIMRGPLRKVAAFCGLAMIGLVAFVVWATVIGGSNIAPILIVFALPPATLAMLVLWTVHIVRRRRPDTRYL